MMQRLFRVPNKLLAPQNQEVTAQTINIVVKSLLAELKRLVLIEVEQFRYPSSEFGTTRPDVLMGVSSAEVLLCPNCEFATKHLQQLLANRNIPTSRLLGQTLDWTLIPFPFNRLPGDGAHMVLKFSFAQEHDDPILIDPVYKSLLLCRLPKESRPQLLQEIPDEVLIVPQSKVEEQANHIAQVCSGLGYFDKREDLAKTLQKAWDLRAYNVC